MDVGSAVIASPFIKLHIKLIVWVTVVNVWGKRFKLPQLTHETFLTIDHSSNLFFWYLPNWTSTDLWCVVLYVTYSTIHQRLVEVQFGRYQKNILQQSSMAKKLSCVSCGSLKRFPHTFTNDIYCFNEQSSSCEQTFKGYPFQAQSLQIRSATVQL